MLELRVLIILVVVSWFTVDVDGGEPCDKKLSSGGLETRRLIRKPSHHVKAKPDKKKIKKIMVVGDMLLTQAQYQYLYAKDSIKRHGLMRSFNHWPHGIVPVKIDKAFDDDYQRVLFSAMDYIMNVSCIKFDLEATGAKDYVFITTGNGCSSQVGNLRQGEQPIRLHTNCKKGNVIHELLHALGFLHMHTATQRDDFVKINYDNIQPRAVKNFEKYTAHVSMFNTQYDYRSIMHYSKWAFAVDKSKPTIIPFERVSAMGQRTEMTEGDITRLNRMYKCPDFVEEEMMQKENESSDDQPPNYHINDEVSHASPSPPNLNEKLSDEQPSNNHIDDEVSHVSPPPPPHLGDEEINDGVMMEDEVTQDEESKRG